MFGIHPNHNAKGEEVYPVITDEMWLDLICLKSQLGYRTKADNVIELKERTLYTLVREYRKVKTREGVAVVFRSWKNKKGEE